MLPFSAMRQRRRSNGGGGWLALAGTTAVLWSSGGQTTRGGTAKVDFDSQIRPVLTENCYKCHGPDDHARKANLRLDVRAEALKPAKSGRLPVVPGAPEKSELIARITATDPKLRMPAASSRKRLTPEQVDVLRRWVAEGAVYATHWAYVTPIRPALPAVRQKQWPKNPVDRFILARLEREGLKPSPPTDRHILIRRVSLDLTGLPPTPEEVDRFVNDPRPQAYEELVNHLLSSPAFGEHWARLWLDLARYADSAGYADDPPRTIWAFRDYVIRAFNSNKPFDRFTLEQIAGDLLPEATDEDRVATAFHRNTMTNNEGGTDDEEFRNAAVVDRVSTTWSVWMGTTMACAQCHNHKYDPITQEEFFRFFAFFNNTEDSDKTDERPVLKLPTTGTNMTTVPVMRELAGAQRRKTHIEFRGNYLALGDEVTPAVPAAFHPLPVGASPDRLAVARWLMDTNNPLTARVLANRFWEQIFGVGIVRTSADFGSQGDRPTHPELLDWLACQFRDGDAATGPWNMKAFLKLLVTSATYCQSSRVTPELQERDAENLLLARGPRFRMNAEVIRDQALAVSDLLSRKMYGPPIRPLRPSLGLSAAFGGSLDWQTSEGEDRYRRAVYVEWRRTSPYPSMATFDAPNREVCALRRPRSNTPLQALVTLNDPVFIEAAQALGRRMAQAPGSVADKVRYGFRLCLARPPIESEAERLTRFFDSARTDFAGVPAKAKAMATEPLGPAPEGSELASLAAWTTVGSILLNLDETLMRP